jgi:hypothetical protein
MDHATIAYGLTWVGTGAWVICFWWMHRISARQDALLTELHAQPAKLMQPGERPFYHPPIRSKPAAMWPTALGQYGSDSTDTQAVAVRFGVIGAIAVDALGLRAGATPLPPDGWNGFDERYELGDIVRVRAGQDHGERHPLGLGDDVVLAPQLPSSHWIQARLRPPKTARPGEESTTARDQSRVSASRNLAKSKAWSLCQTPARCHARRYRQQVIPEPQPSSWGSMFQGIPLFKTKRMRVSIWRGTNGLRPGQRTRRGLGGGKKGSIKFHSWSSSNGFAMSRPPRSARNTWYINGNRDEAQSFC